MTELIYRENSYLTNLKANVISCNNVDDKCELVLDKTIFYPDGVGGQKGDIGTIDEIRVEKSLERGNEIIHILEKCPKEKTVTIEIDKENRKKIMQQHTTEHLIGATFKYLYDIDVLSFHASDDFIFVDLDTEEMTDEMIKQAEFLANEKIQENLPIISYYPNDEEIKKIHFRRPPKVHENLRVVQIGEFDYAACGGTHLKTTGELGLVKIVDYKRQNKNIRLKIASGNVSLNDYTVKNSLVQKLGEKLSANETNLLEKFETFEEQNRELSEKYNKIKELYLQELKNSLLQNAKIVDNHRIIFYNFDFLSFDNANLFAKSFEGENELILILYKIDKDNSKILMRLYDVPDIDFSSLKKRLQAEINFKGGGKNGLLQGVADIDKDTLEEKITNVLFE